MAEEPIYEDLYRQIEELEREKRRFEETEAALKDYVAYQSVLAALRAVKPESTDEQILQILLSGIVEHYGFRTAWYGHYVNGQVRSALTAGQVDPLLTDLVLDIREASAPDAQCAMSRAILDDTPFSYADMENDEGFRRWRDYARRMGYRSNLALPLKVEKQVEGGILIYADIPHAFPKDRIERLELLTVETGAMLRERRLRRQHEEAVRTSHRFLETQVKDRTVALKRINRELEQEIRERKEAEAALRKAHAQLVSIFNTIPGTIDVVDTEFNIIDVNDKFMQVHVPSHGEDILGQKCYRIIKNRDSICPECVVKKVYETGIVECRVTTDEEEELFGGSYKIYASPIRDPEGNITGAVECAVDVTDLKLIHEELRQAKVLADGANVAKSQFLANMSHEIRTPMNAVIGMTELLRGTDLTDEQREYADTVHTSANSLLQIINDILDFSKIEAGALELELIDFNLRTIAQDISALLTRRIQTKGVGLQWEIDPQVPSWVRGDPGRLRQILLNLANNAVKFTEDGDIVVGISVAKETDSDVTLRFAVTDTGIGIPEDRLDRLFKPFSQADASTTRRFGGSGLGLAICKQLVEKMDGTIGVESREGKGSTFWFTVVLEKRPAQEKMWSDATADIQGKRILIVTDHHSHLTFLSSYLKTWGCHFCIARSPQETRSRLREATGDESYDLIIVDTRMPDADVESLAKYVKSDPTLGHIRMVMLTSMGQRGDGAKMKKLGFSAYLTDSLTGAQLYQCLTTVLGYGGGQDGSGDTSPLVTRHSLAEQHQTARILLVEDNAVNQKLALRFLEKLGFTADAVGNGPEAIKALEETMYSVVLMDVQMPQMDGYETTRVIRNPASNVRNHDIPIVAMTAHAMKGDRERCLEAGMNDYIAKPIRSEQLYMTIQKYLARA